MQAQYAKEKEAMEAASQAIALKHFGRATDKSSNLQKVEKNKISKLMSTELAQLGLGKGKGPSVTLGNRLSL